MNFQQNKTDSKRKGFESLPPQLPEIWGFRYLSLAADQVPPKALARCPHSAPHSPTSHLHTHLPQRKRGLAGPKVRGSRLESPFHDPASLAGSLRQKLCPHQLCGLGQVPDSSGSSSPSLEFEDSSTARFCVCPWCGPPIRTTHRNVQFWAHPDPLTQNLFLNRPPGDQKHAPTSFGVTRKFGEREQMPPLKAEACLAFSKAAVLTHETGSQRDPLLLQHHPH